MLAGPVPAAPRPAAAAPQPGPSDWRTPDPNDVLVIDTNKGRVLVELVPEAAPQFVAARRELTRQHVYDGQTFFRVIDDFMDQTGDPKNNGTGGSTLPDVPGRVHLPARARHAVRAGLDQTVAESAS